MESLEDLDRRLETRGWRFAADVSTPDCLTWDSPGPNAATSSLVLSGLGDDDEPLPRERWVFEISSELPDGSEDVVSLDWSTFSPRLDDAGDNHAGSDDAPSSIN